MQLERDIREVLNRHSAENGSNTPDYILAEYLMNCMEAFDKAVNAREQHEGRQTAASATPYLPGVREVMKPNAPRQPRRDSGVVLDVVVGSSELKGGEA